MTFFNPIGESWIYKLYKQKHMKTAMQKLLEILESKILPCPDGNDYVYGQNVAHENLIYNIKNGFLEIEKEQIIKAYEDGADHGMDVIEDGLDYIVSIEYYNKTYNQNK